MATVEELEARIAALEERLNEVPFRVPSLRIDNHDSHPAIFFHQIGNSTAVVGVQSSSNPAVKLKAEGNAASIEIEQIDGEDAIVAIGADIRCEQVILVGEAPHVALAPHGAIQWAYEDDPLEYFDRLSIGEHGSLSIH